MFRNGGLQPPNPDAVQESQLITSNYNAEYGRSAGGVINTVTKWSESICSTVPFSSISGTSTWMPEASFSLPCRT